MAETHLSRPLDREGLAWFRERMAEKLEENRYKKPWSEKEIDYLFRRMLDEVEELRHALRDTQANRYATKESIIPECADVANFAMMIANNVNRGRK